MPEEYVANIIAFLILVGLCAIAAGYFMTIFILIAGAKRMLRKIKIRR